MDDLSLITIKLNCRPHCRIRLFVNEKECDDFELTHSNCITLSVPKKINNFKIIHEGSRKTKNSVSDNVFVEFSKLTGITITNDLVFSQLEWSMNVYNDCVIMINADYERLENGPKSINLISFLTANNISNAKILKQNNNCTIPSIYKLKYFTIVFLPTLMTLLLAILIYISSRELIIGDTYNLINIIFVIGSIYYICVFLVSIRKAYKFVFKDKHNIWK